MKIVKILRLFVLCILIPYPGLIFCQADKAYQHLYNVMDKYHETFNVFSDQDEGGNNFYPAFLGDYQNIILSTDGAIDSLPGYNCLKMIYTSEELADTALGWAGIYWLYPEGNWGEYPGYNLIDADSLTFWAKGNSGGENVEFKVGGIYEDMIQNDSSVIDSSDLLSTGIITLQPYWKRYTIDFEKKDSFYIYLDGNSGSINHYIPSMWFNGDSNMLYDQNYFRNPHSGESCIKIEWNGKKGNDGYLWNGIMWQAIEGDVENGFDLTGATMLSFWAKAGETGLGIKFFLGIKDKDSCGEILYGTDGWASLDTVWKEYIINLSGKDLSNVAGGFGFAFNDVNDEDPDGFVFYLDDIKFDRLINKELLNLIGGFCCVAEKDRNPDGCSFYMDNIQFNLDSSAVAERKNNPHFLVSFEATDKIEDKYIRNAAYIYDNALAMIAFMNRGNPDDWQRAEVIANTFIACQENDRDFTDNTLRNGYMAGDVIDHYTGKAKIPGAWSDEDQEWFEDEFSASTHTGNIAWVMIALAKYYKEKGGVKYLNCIKSLGDWIVDNTYDTRGAGGFTGGFEGFGHSRVLWKSTEHNLDLYVAFKLLYEITGNDKWNELADHAKHFVEAMWNNENKYFWTGTTQDGVTINQDVYPLDAQTWGILVFKGECKYQPAIEWVHNNFYVEDNGFKGFDFNNDLDGIWYEGTSQMILAFQQIGQISNSQLYIEELRKAQANENNNNKLGIVASSCDNLSTGLYWLYHNRLHIGATAWYIFAENSYNPYWGDTIIPKTDCPLNVKGINTGATGSMLFQNYPNPFSSSTIIPYYLAKPGYTVITLYDIQGSLIKILTEGYNSAGMHELILDSQEHNLTKGIYLYKINTDNYLAFKKCIVN
jgi:hypothetical protein